jgi:hypothetical protein
MFLTAAIIIYESIPRKRVYPVSGIITRKYRICYCSIKCLNEAKNGRIFTRKSIQSFYNQKALYLPILSKC